MITNVLPPFYGSQCSIGDSGSRLVVIVITLVAAAVVVVVVVVVVVSVVM